MGCETRTEQENLQYFKVVGTYYSAAQSSYVRVGCIVLYFNMHSISSPHLYTWNRLKMVQAETSRYNDFFSR